jgi:octaprenyl-diphosphate synthase
MVGMKTGSLLEAPLVTGAIAGGGSKKIIHCLKNFGRNLGIAFQIIDDSLTIVSGNSKPKYLDILSGKVTPLLIFALNNASIKERDFILRVAGHKNAKESELKKIVRIYEKYECIKFAQSLSSKYIKEAKSSIGELKDSIPKQLLLEIAKTLDIWSLWKPR